MRAWIEINTENLKHNIEKIKELSKGSKLLPVIKANAYGLGAVEIAKILEKINIEMIGLANLKEAIELQDAGIKTELIILGSLLEEEIEEAVARKIHINISSQKQLEFLKEKNLKALIHIKVDTGMGRVGFDMEEAWYAISYCKINNIKITGIFSHFSDAASDDLSSREYTLEQINKFREFEKLDYIKYKHLFNSAGILFYNQNIVGNMVRFGIAMYGLIGNEKIKNFKDVFTLKTKILYKKTLKEDSYISYNREYMLKKGESYATLPLGYADGIRKYFSEGSYVIIEGEKCPVIGVVCMDMFMVKLSEKLSSKVEVGTEVIVLSNDIIADVNVEKFFSGELLTGMGRRVERVYI